VKAIEDDPVVIGRKEQPLIAVLAQFEQRLANFDETLENLVPKVEFPASKRERLEECGFNY
jgi:hypothetical protein